MIIAPASVSSCQYAPVTVSSMAGTAPCRGSDSTGNYPHRCMSGVAAAKSGRTYGGLGTTQAAKLKNTDRVQGGWLTKSQPNEAAGLEMNDHLG